MSNRNFNKQTTNARQGLADGGPAGGKDDPKRNLGPRKRSPGPRSGRPSLADTIRKATPPSNPRKKFLSLPARQKLSVKSCKSNFKFSNIFFILSWGFK